MGWHRNHAISHSPNQNFFEDTFVSHPGGPNEQFGTHEKLSWGGVQGNLNWMPGYKILSVFALDEINTSGCLHFSMKNIGMSCDLNCTSRRSNVNVIKLRSLFIDVCMTPSTCHPGVMFTSFTPWLFKHLRYK